jgi:hypothetical protein
MGIKFYCPSCDKRLNVKSFLAGKSGFCPQCQAKIQIPAESQPKRTKSAEAELSGVLRQPELQHVQGAPAHAKGHPSGNGHGKPHVAAAPAAVAPVAQVQPATGYAAPYPAAAQPVAGGPVANPNMPSPGGYSPLQAQPVQVQPVAYGAAPVAPTVPVAPAPAMVDPIAEAPHAVWYVRPPAGGQYGPAAGDLMRKWMGEGRVSADSLVWREGWPDWRKGSKVFPSLAPAAAPAAAAPQVAAAPMAPVGTPRRTLKAPRKKNSTTLAITAIIVLVLLSIALLIGLLYVLGAI